MTRSTAVNQPGDFGWGDPGSNSSAMAGTPTALCVFDGIAGEVLGAVAGHEDLGFVADGQRSVHHHVDG